MRRLLIALIAVLTAGCGTDTRPLQPVRSDDLEDGELAQRALVLGAFNWQVAHKGKMPLPEPAYRALYRTSLERAWTEASLGEGLEPAYEVTVTLPDRADFRTASLISDSVSRARVQIHRPDGTLATDFDVTVVSAKALLEDPACAALGHRYAVPALAVKLAWTLEHLRRGDVTVTRLIEERRLPNAAYELLRLNPYRIHAMTAEATERITGLQLARFDCPPDRWTRHGLMPITRLSTRERKERGE